MVDIELNAENAMFELMHSLATFEREYVACADMLKAYDRFVEIRLYVESFNIDDTFLKMYGQELVGIAPSIFKKDRKAVCEELRVAAESFAIKTIAHSIYTFIRNLIIRIIEFTKRLFIESRRIQANFISLRKRVDLNAHIDMRTIPYNGYDYSLVMNTLADHGGMFSGVSIVDKAAATYGGGYVKAFEALIDRQSKILNLPNEKRLFQYDAVSYTFSARVAQKGYPSLADAGVSTSLTLHGIADAIEANLDMMRQFEISEKRFLTALDILEKEYGQTSPDVVEYVKAHSTYITSYMSVVPTIIFDIARSYMRVMKYIITPEKDIE